MLFTNIFHRYRSVFSAKIRDDIARAKSAHKTFGQPVVPLRPPGDYLKKYSRIEPARPINNHIHPSRPEFRQKMPEWKPGKIPAPKPKIPPLPKDPALVDVCNFRRTNFINAINSCPKQPVPRHVDTVKGDTFDLKPSGWMPIYVYKKVSEDLEWKSKF